MPTTIEDRLVVGDVSVVADLYRQHGAFIHTISQELVGAAADRLTQQVFVEAWRDRLDFNPSLGTVRNWLVRRARTRVSKPSTETGMAVDRLVVADSLHRMEDLRRQVVLAGYSASDVESLARRIDQPAATVRANLRRGRDQLKSDLVDSRLVDDDEGLVEIMADGPPSLDLVLPPEVVWQAIAAELNLDTGAVTMDDFTAVDEPPEDRAGDEGREDDGVSDVDGGDQIDGRDGQAVAAGEEAEVVEAVEGDESSAGTAIPDEAGAQTVEESPDRSDVTGRRRSGWVTPTVVVMVLVIVVIALIAVL